MSDDANDGQGGENELNQQPHGGALVRAGYRRPATPTPNDVRQLARKRFYQVVPQLNRIARNANRKTKSGATKRSYRVADQIRAAALLGQYGMDNHVSAADVRDALRQTTAEIREFLPPDQAQALLSKIAPHWLEL